METVNISLIIAGVVVVLFGVGAFLNPNISRWINAPGPPVIKAIIAIISGIILIIVGFVFQFTT